MATPILPNVTSYATLAALEADSPPDGTMAVVYADPTPTNNRSYVRQSGAWVTDYDPLAYALGNRFGFQQAGTGAVLRTFQNKMRDVVSIEDFGGIGDGVTDNTQAFANAAGAGVSKIYLPAGHYMINGSAGINLSNMDVQGDGDDTIIDCTNCTATYPIYSLGALVVLPALASNASVGQWTLTFASAPSIAVGNVLCIYNPTASSFSGFRTYYTQGEFCEVLAVSGTTVTLRAPLYDNYAAASVNIYLLQSVLLKMRDMQLIGGTSSAGLLQASLTLNPILERMTVVGTNDSAIYIDRCFGGALRDLRVSNLGQGSSTNPYGLIIGNSQHVRVYGGDYYGRWEGTDFGGASLTGAVPCRDCTISDAVIRNDSMSPNGSSTSEHAAGMHGNTEACGYLRCTIYGGAAMSGVDPFIEGGVIYAQNNGVVIDGNEVLGGIYRVHDVKMYSITDPHLVGRSFVDVGGNSTAITSSTTRNFTLEVRGGSLSVASVTANATSAVGLANRGASVVTNVEVTGLTVSAPATFYVLAFSYASGTASANYIIVDNIAGLPAGSPLASINAQYLSFPLRMQSQSGYVSGTTTAAANYIASPVTLSYSYPREPRVTVCLTGAAGAAMSLLGGQVGVPGQYQISQSQVRPQVYSASGANFAAGVNFELHWMTGINEC